MSWPHGPVQSEGPQGNSFSSSAFPGQQAKGDGQGNKSNRNFPLYIVNIPLDIDEDQLRKMFSEAGDVTYSKCLPPKEGRNSCVGFISYNTEEEAQKAISLFNNVQINRMTLRVDYTKSFKEGRSLKLDNAKSSFPSGQQDDQGSYSSHNGYSQRQDSPGLNSRESQPVDVHSIGRGIHFDYDDSGNQFHAIGGGIHPELLKSVPNDPGQGSYNPGSLPATHDFQPNYSETSNLKIPSSNLNGPLEPSAMQYGSSFYSHGYEEKSPQDMHSYHMNPQVQEARTVQGDPSFGTYNYHNVISQDVLSSYSEQTMQSTYTNRSQAPMSTQSNSSFENYNCQENLTENPQSGVNSPQIPSYSPVQGGHSTERTSEVKMDSLVNGFAGMEVTQPVNNHSFGSNQYQVSSRLPRSQTGASFGERICHRCREPGHFARECPKSSPGGDRNSNCYQCDQPGRFSRECPNRSVRGQRGACHRGGEQDHFARECPNNGQEQEGSSPRPPQKVDYVPPPLPDDVDLLFKAAVHKGINFDRFDSIPVEVTGNNPTTAIQTFDELFLPDTLKSNLGKAEFTKPTPVQKYGIPIILNGRDIMACAQTGSGKTVAFLLPVMAGMVNSRLPEASYLGGDAASPAALCVAPTRELALQIYTEALKFSSGTYLRPVVCYGGVSVQYQLQNVERGCHILIGTPGRILDFVGRNKVSLTNVRYLILDEADRMLDMGFENDVRKIVCQFGMPEKTQRQTLMFSATFPDEIQKLAGEFLNDYLYLAVGRVGGSNLDIKQEILDLQNDQKRPTLLDIIRQSGQDKTLVFVERKRQADFLANWLSQNKYPTTSISGDRSQKEREDALRDFRNGRAPVLIATSVAARGLDIPDVKHVINYDLPQQIEDYVHRIGRTGRIGNQGSATAFFERGRDDKLARSLVKVLSDAVQDVPNWLEEVAERALGTSYGPAGGKFASRDTRQFDSRRSGNTGGDDSSRPSPTTNVSFTNQSFPRTSSVVENGDDEEEWD